MSAPPESGAVAEPEVVAELRGSAWWIRLNRPRVLNALNAAAFSLLADAIAQAEADDRVRAIVIIGEGGRAFSSGGDLSARNDDSTAGRDHTEGLSKAAFGAVRHCRKPTIAAVDGHCMGAGFEIAALCDIRIATEQSRFVLPEVRRCLMPDPGLIDLPRLLPRGELLLMLLAGRPLPARRAHEIGLVQELLPDRSALIAAAEALAADIALGAPRAAEDYKHIVRETEADLTRRAEELRNPLWDVIRTSQDGEEAARAWSEKRPPRWQGR